MKRWMPFVVMLMISVMARSQSVQLVSGYGFLMATNVAGSLIWTNDTAYPFKFNTMTFNSTVANTATVQRVHTYKVNQERGWVVTTNAMGTVDSNFYAQVTNVLSYVSTNLLLSITNSGETVYTKDEIKQLWVHFGDVIRWNFSDTNSKTLLYDTTR